MEVVQVRNYRVPGSIEIPILIKVFVIAISARAHISNEYNTELSCLKKHMTKMKLFRVHTGNN